MEQRDIKSHICHCQDLSSRLIAQLIGEAGIPQPCPPLILLLHPETNREEWRENGVKCRTQNSISYIWSSAMSTMKNCLSATLARGSHWENLHIQLLHLLQTNPDMACYYKVTDYFFHISVHVDYWSCTFHRNHTQSNSAVVKAVTWLWTLSWWNFCWALCLQKPRNQFFF